MELNIQPPTNLQKIQSSPRLDSTLERCKGTPVRDRHTFPEDKGCKSLTVKAAVTKTKTQGNIKCPHCSNANTFKSGLSKHQKKHHAEKIQNEPSGYINCNSR